MASAESNPLDFGDKYYFDAISAPPVGISPTIPRGAPPQSAARRPASGGDTSNLGAAYEYFLSKGFAPHQAAGIVGNIAQESGGHTGAHGDLSLPGGGSIGIAQWNRERLHGGNGYTGLLPFAQAQGMDPKSLYTQLDYMMHEMKGPERKALQNVMAARTVEEATRAFGEGYERPNAKHANYENRIAQAQRFLGARGEAPEQQPQINPADFQRIPLSNGKILTVPKDVDRQQAINDLRAQGMDVEGMTPHPLTNGKTLHLPDSADVNTALADLQKQQPDQEWMTKAHAEKSGFIPAAKAAAAGLGSTLVRGPSEWMQEIPALKDIGTAGIEKSKEWSKYAQDTAEAPLSTDPLSQKMKYYGGTAAGGFGPFVAGAALAPEAMAPALLAGTMASSATGSLAQRFDEQKKDFSPLEHIPAIAGETALQYGTTAVLGPLRQLIKSPAITGLMGKDASAHVEDLIKTQGFDAAKAAVGERVLNVAKEAGINISSMAAGDVASMAIERISAGQSLSDKSFKDELESTLATDLMGGAVMGPASGVLRQGQMERAYNAKAQEAAAVGPQPEAPPVTPPPGEAPTPPEGPAETIEDLESRIKQYPKREAAEEQPPVSEEVPEPKVRPTPGAWFKDVTGLGNNTGVAKRFKTAGLDIDNPEHHQDIVDLIKGEEGQKSTALTDEHAVKIVDRINEQRLGAGLEPIGAEYASKIEGPEPADAGGGKRPQGGEEIGYPSEGGEGIRGGDQEGQKPTGEGKGQKEVTLPKELAKAKENFGYGPKKFSLSFANDIDRAAYIARNAEKPSKRDQDYLQFVMDNTGMSEAEVRKHGTEVHKAIKDMAKDADSGTLEVPHVYGKDERLFAKGEEGNTHSKAEEPTHIDVDGVQRPVQDSTGQRIHTTDEGVKNFWKGFEGTKAVDAEGRPQVVYHGTDKDFNAFEMQRPTKRWTTFSENNVTSQGAFFSPDPADASGYGKRVIASYLNIKNPLVDPSAITASSRNPEEKSRAEKGWSDAEYILEPLIYEADGRKWIDTDNGISRTEVDPEGSWVSKALQDNQIDWAYLDNPAVVERMKERGYDGVKVYEPNDEAGYSWFVTEPNQIKSATENKGAFDTTKPDIREARGVAPEAAHSVESLNEHIKSTYGENAPRVDVLTREQAGVEPNVKGFYDPSTKRVTLIADNIGKGEDVHGLMRHEVAVHARRLGKSDPEFQAILDRLQSLKDSGNAEVMRAYERVPKDTNPEHVHEEALAYLSQHAPKLPIVKQFTSWIRRTAHKLTGSSNWLKAEDFGPMADAILKKGEVAPRVSKERLYTQGDAHEQAAQSAAATHRSSWWDRTKEALEHKYTKIQTAAVSSKAALTHKLGQQEMYGANGEIRAKAKVDQATHVANMVGESYEHGYIQRNRQGLNEVVHDDNLALNKWRDRFSAMPEHVRNSFENAIDTLAKAGHNLRLSEHMETIKEGKEQIKLADARRTEIVEEMKMLQRHGEEATSRYVTLKAQKEFLTEEIADRKKLADMIEDRYTRAQRSDGKLFDVSDEEVAAARSLIDSTPETKELAKHLREILHNDAKLLRDNQVISDAAYEKFTDPKYDYAPRYMQMEDLAEHLPASETYGAGLRSSAAPKKIRGGQHEINLLENLFAHRAKMTTMALHNNARLGALKTLQDLGEATPLAPNARPTRGQPTIDVMEGGKRRHYEVPDRALLEAFEIIQHMPIKIISTGTKVISKYMLMNPGYLYRQLWREPIMSAATSGMGIKAGLSMPFSTVKTLASLVLHKTGNDHILFDQLRAQGVTASHNYLKDYVQEMGKPYAEPTTKVGKAQEKAKGFIKAMEHAHELVDGATKVAVMKRLKAQAESGELTGTPLHGDQARDAAISKVASIINMQQRGRSAGMHYLTQTTPFFNSWAQGMDSILRNATGHGMTPHEAKRARQSFWAHAAALTAFSTGAAIAMSMYSEKYRKARPEDYLNNWVMPFGDRLLKGAAPFELTVFKAIPEMLVRRSFGLDRGVENSKLAEIGIWRNILPPGAESLGIPFIVKPVAEALIGHEIKYWGDKRAIGNQNIAPEIRGRGKSAYADILSDLTGISPAAISHVSRGYAPEMDTAINTMTNLSAAVFSSKKGRELTRDMTEVVPFLHNIVTNPTKLDTSIEDFNAEQKMLKATGKYMQRRGMEGAREYIKEGRYSKATGNLEEAIAKTNIRLERLRNSEDFKDAEEAQRKADALRARSEQLHERMIKLKERKEEAED